MAESNVILCPPADVPESEEVGGMMEKLMSLLMGGYFLENNVSQSLWCSPVS